MNDISYRYPLGYDEIVEEVHAIRKQIAEEFNYDFEKLGEHLMRLQEQHPEHLVYDVPPTEPEPEPQQS
jgi:hypothetical protein